jgi:signal transduction histidine kinase
MMLFVTLMADSLGLTLTGEDLNKASKLTFLNVVAISLLFTVIDSIRRYFAIERPIKKIGEAAERIIEGDFSVRIPRLNEAYGENSLNRVIDCFNKMAEELSGTETLRTDFIANVSHELKTPLSVMQNYAVMLQSKSLSEEERVEYARAISESSKRLAALITNILKLNKLENQQIIPLSESYDLGEQICECLLAFEDVWEKKNIEIETDIGDGVTVCADPEMMSLVWNNLFSNAFKFTDNGGKVCVKVFCDGEDAVVKIEDTGCGISGEVGAHMFDKFYQGDTSHSAKGNGLGLSIVKRIIDLLSAEIYVESEPGVGSTFTVRIAKRTH